MKTKKLWRYISIVVVVVLALAAVGTVVGQEPGPEGQPAPDATAMPTEFPDDVDQGSEGQIEPQEIVLAQPPYTMNYQGYLTDGGGSPLNGTYNLRFRLLDALTGGSVLWGPEIHNNVQVTNGLFHAVVGETVPLLPHYFDEALFFQVYVDGTWLTPRQPLHAVPYAYGLVPGAEVQGDPDGTNYGLFVRNEGSASNDRGLYAFGEDYGIYAGGGTYGIYAEETGTGDVGIYSPDFVMADGYKAAWDSYLWIPGNAATLYAGQTANCAVYQGGAYGRLECNASGNKELWFPVTMPGVLLGQEVRVEQITVYYKTQNANTYITSTRLAKAEDVDSYEWMLNNGTDRKSLTASHYSLNTTDAYTLTSSSGPVSVYLLITHDGNTAHDLYIGPIRLRLGHTD